MQYHGWIPPTSIILNESIQNRESKYCTFYLYQFQTPKKQIYGGRSQENLDIGKG